VGIIQDSGVRIRDSGIRIRDSGVRIQDSGVRSQVPGVRACPTVIPSVARNLALVREGKSQSEIPLPRLRDRKDIGVLDERSTGGGQLTTDH